MSSKQSRELKRLSFESSYRFAPQKRSCPNKSTTEFRNQTNRRGDMERRGRKALVEGIANKLGCGEDLARDLVKIWESQNAWSNIKLRTLGSGGLQSAALAAIAEYQGSIGNTPPQSIWNAKKYMRSYPDTCFRAIGNVYRDPNVVDNTLKRRKALLKVIQSGECGFQNTMSYVHPDDRNEHIFSLLSYQFGHPYYRNAILMSTTNLQNKHAMFHGDLIALSEYFSRCTNGFRVLEPSRTETKSILQKNYGDRVRSFIHSIESIRKSNRVSSR